MEEYVRSVYGGKVTANDKGVIAPLEIDVFLPDAKTGIEFDGLYWHSAVWRSDLTHMYRKSVICERNGIALFHVLEDEWKEFRAQTEWRVKLAVCGECGEKPAVTKTREIRDTQFEQFMARHSNDKYAKRGKTKFGIFDDEKLVFAASVTKYRDRAVIYTIQSAIGVDCSGLVKCLVAAIRERHGDVQIFARLDGRYPYDRPLLAAGFALEKTTAPAEWIVDAKSGNAFRDARTERSGRTPKRAACRK